MYTDNNIVMMRNLHPTSALPVTRNMPYYSASVPSRNQPRNMTGIYLGLEGNVNPPANRETKITRARTGVSQKIRTPAEDRRYKMVELLRIKEETKGFRGKLLKKHQPVSTDIYGEESSTPRCSHPKQLKHRKWGPAKSADPKHFDDVIKRNPRNYTGIINNGVTRSENLTGVMSFADHFGWDISNMPLSDALVEEVQRMANERNDLGGIEECFKKVCKGNVESLHSLLPLRKPVTRPSSYTPGTFTPGNYSTGFTVRSYRNPNKAEILADFDLHSEHTRPKTVPATSIHNQRQPLVPAPYFFKHFNRAGTASSTKKRNSPNSQFEVEHNNVLNGDKIFGGPGSGAVSRSVNQGRKSAWSEGEGSRIRRGTPRNDSPIKDIDRSRHDNSLQSTGPLEIRAEGFQLNSEDKAPLSDRTGAGDGNLTNRSETSVKHSDRKPVDKSGSNKNLEVVGQSNFGMEGQSDNGDKTIRLDLETEDGRKQEIFLDDKGRR
ncbi:uncharacterized protein LOC132729413 isoform X2 [Ruditapes philippinarum]|uniref:uncharacterized protein LOC132729413 isoform X2 n=1 Tax=Ruditapes philippinarum TaxID=129788 RepID=UPI00295B012D|nr:uncharacterized protein LOC132729413 isoform X2 [Ruditapes philippinarum]